jgi:Resolvase, N terminal domain
MNSLKPRRRFDVLVMSEESRLGREAIETAYALKQLISAGVRVFFYLENRERTLETATDKLLMSVTAFAAELRVLEAAAPECSKHPDTAKPSTDWTGQRSDTRVYQRPAAALRKSKVA